jgi:hypothetical protein
MPAIIAVHDLLRSAAGAALVSLASPEESLHKGLGVRKDGLVEHLGVLGARMHVSADEPAHVVLAKVIWQMSRMIRLTTRDKKWITVLEVAYNLPQEPGFNERILKDRLRWLADTQGKGWDTSTMNSQLSVLRRRSLLRLLAQPSYPSPSQAELAELAESELAYANRGGAPDHQRFLLPRDVLGQLISDRYKTGRQVPSYALPQAELHFAVSAAGNLVTIVTAGFGEVLAVFTTEELLRAFRAAVGAPESDRPVSSTGRDVIAALVRQERVGLAVNPLGGHGAGTGMYWSPEELAEL